MAVIGFIGFVVSVIMFICIIGIGSSTGESTRLLREILKELKKEVKK